MRILFITSNRFMPEHACGQNRTILELCRRLHTMGHDPVVLSGRSDHQGRGGVVQERGFGFRLIRADNLMHAVSAVCVTLRPDALVLFDGDFDGLIDACAPLQLPTLVWFFHVEPYYFLNREPDRNLLYLATSPFLAHRIERLFNIDVQVLPPYIELDNYQKNLKGKRVLFVNPVREKGVEMLFEFARRRPSIPFTVVESWGLATAWRKLCFERALHCGNIEWIPKSVDMESAFQQARMLLVPRYSEEGFCRLVTEAQAGGLPVLASDRGNLPDNVGEGGSVLSMDADLEQWLERIDAYTGQDTLHQDLAHRARKHSERPAIAADTMLDRLLGLLATRLSESKTRRYSGRA